MTHDYPYRFRDQLIRYRPLRALRSMKTLPHFHSDFCSFILEESRREASKTTVEKDEQSTEFNMESIKKFSYESELEKFQKTNPILLAALVGTISKQKVEDYSDISRKGFGGPFSSSDIDLVPCVVQTASRILKNRHPRSISNIPCMNSVYLWGNRVPGKVLHFFNTLGDSYR